MTATGRETRTGSGSPAWTGSGGGAGVVAVSRSPAERAGGRSLERLQLGAGPDAAAPDRRTTAFASRRLRTAQFPDVVASAAWRIAVELAPLRHRIRHNAAGLLILPRASSIGWTGVRAPTIFELGYLFRRFPCTSAAEEIGIFRCERLAN